MEQQNRSRKVRDAHAHLGWKAGALSCLLLACACGKFEQEPTELSTESPREAVRIVVLQVTPEQPRGPDEPPRVELAQLDVQGGLTPLPGDYLAAETFRRGAAAVTIARQLHLVHPDGSHSVLARRTDGLPATEPDGSLVFAARFGDKVEIHRLRPSGENSRLASFRGTVTQLTPRASGRIFFVGAKKGGVVGLWIVDDTGARCITNCELKAGKDWGDSYQAPPRNLTTVQIFEESVRWPAADGGIESAPLPRKGTE